MAALRTSGADAHLGQVARAADAAGRQPLMVVASVSVVPASAPMVLALFRMTVPDQVLLPPTRFSRAPCCRRRCR